ncbi:MAG TPA: bifunctional diguanylate cyclase/phosphodiesterase [Methylocystis sp.]|nr:bifunctional diguanylate cyclase/phosphodiesterase [Methylocystis sp.]
MQLRHLAARALMQSPPLAALPAHPESRPSAASEAPPMPNCDDILSSIGELTYEWDLAHDRLLWGENLDKVLGAVASADLSTGMAFGARLSLESSTSRYDAIMKSDKRDEGAGVRYEIIYGLTPPRETGGAPIWLEDHGCWFAGSDGRPARAHGVVRVITERHQMERKLARQSQFDPLTGVLNRTQLTERIERMLDGYERNRKPFAVILVALENLFALNRTYGYDAGDEVIAGLATRLAQNLRGTDVIGRHAGNKFAIALEACDTEQAQAAAMRLIDQVASAPFETAVGPVPARIRIGGVVAPREGRTVQVLFQRAEEALDVARQRVGARFVVYSASLAREDSRLRALQIADNILAALSERRVELAFQPIVDAADGQPVFYEALLRVRLADGTVVSPGSILPVAEKAGLVRLLDQRVLELALARLVEKPKLNLSINASLASLLDPEWLERLTAGCAATEGLAERLTVEITETSVIEDVEATSHVIAACKRFGVKVAMDDFGAGHTSFRNLRALAFDLVKIDGAFVQNIAKSADDRFFVRTLINLAHHLGLRIVAEWVEDSETATLLREWGVDYFQGSFYGSAGPENAQIATV